MYLERGGPLVQDLMTLVFVVIAYRVSLPVGLALLAFMGVIRIQESFTDWCPSEIVLRLIGLRKKGEPR